MNHSQLHPKNIIVRMPNWLGDLVMATPILADLRAALPNAKITAMCQGGSSALISADPNLDEIYAFAKPSGWLHREPHAQIIEKLRQGEYDLGLLLTNSFSSAWWFWRGHVKNRIGYEGNLRSPLLNFPLKHPANIQTQHLVKTYKELLAPLGIPVSDSKPKLYLTPAEIASSFEWLKARNIDPDQHVIIGVNPGAAYGSAKCWLPERFVEVSKHLISNPNVRILYFGDAAGKPLVDKICQEIDSPHVINAAAKTSLRELLGLISRCRLLLTNDSGPMHIADALDVPLIALFGSTSDVKTGPYRGGLVIHKRVECSPCYKKVCPIDFRCMKRIESDEVYQAIIKTLNLTV